MNVDYHLSVLLQLKDLPSLSLNFFIYKLGLNEITDAEAELKAWPVGSRRVFRQAWGLGHGQSSSPPAQITADGFHEAGL